MNRLSIAGIVVAASVAVAQDMPLHDIIQSGETWQSHSGEMPKRPPGGYHVGTKNGIILIDRVTSKSWEPVMHPLKEPTACVVALGGAQFLVADATDRYVWAFRIEKDGTLGPGDRYCRLRVLGDERRKNVTAAEKYRADPSAMTTDNANRSYVATNLGIQVFDPTGRLCGVFTSPPGRISELRFDGNQLFARAAGKVYVRKMMERAAK